MKTTKSEQSHPNREVTRATTSKTPRVRPPKPFRAHILPLFTLTAGHRATGLNVYPESVQGFSLAFLQFISMFPFCLEREYPLCTTVYWESLDLIFIEPIAKSFPWMSKDFPLRLFSKQELLKLWWLLEIYTMHLVRQWDENIILGVRGKLVRLKFKILNNSQRWHVLRWLQYMVVVVCLPADEVLT